MSGAERCLLEAVITKKDQAEPHIRLDSCMDHNSETYNCSFKLFSSCLFYCPFISNGHTLHKRDSNFNKSIHIFTHHIYIYIYILQTTFIAMKWHVVMAN